jgi:hypothetical protein
MDVASGAPVLGDTKVAVGGIGVEVRDPSRQAETSNIEMRTETKLGEQQE